MRQNTLLPLGCLSVLLLLLPRPGFASPKKLRVTYDRSSIVAVTHKAGLLRFLGHEHGILATAWSADVTYDDATPAASGVAIKIPVRALVIDTESARVKAGLDKQGPSADDVNKMQQKMLSEKVFDAEKYPEITFSTTSIEPQAAEKWLLKGLLTIREISRPVTVSVTITRHPEAVNVTGRFTIKQTSYGIKPESIAGVVEVADEVDIQFDIWVMPEA